MVTQTPALSSRSTHACDFKQSLSRAHGLKQKKFGSAAPAQTNGSAQGESIQFSPSCFSSSSNSRKPQTRFSSFALQIDPRLHSSSSLQSFEQYRCGLSSTQRFSLLQSASLTQGEPNPPELPSG